MKVYVLLKVEDYHGYSQIDPIFYDDEDQANIECEFRNSQLSPYDEKWIVEPLTKFCH